MAERGSMVLLAEKTTNLKALFLLVQRRGFAQLHGADFLPFNCEEIIESGRHAVALSRHAGIVTALKLVTPVCDERVRLIWHRSVRRSPYLRAPMKNHLIAS